MWVEFILEWVEWVLFSAPRGFSPGTPVVPSPQKPTFPNSNSIWNCQALYHEPLARVIAQALPVFDIKFAFAYLHLHFRLAVRQIAIAYISRRSIWSNLCKRSAFSDDGFVCVMISLRMKFNVNRKPVNLLIIWLCLTRTGNYQIHEFDWLKWILTAVWIFPSRPASIDQR